MVASCRGLLLRAWVETTVFLTKSRWLLITAWDRGDCSSQDSGQSLPAERPKCVENKNPEEMKYSSSDLRWGHMLAVYIKHSFTHSLEFRVCLMNFPYTLEFFTVAFTTAICCANKTWQVTCTCYTSTWTKTKKTSNPYSLDRGVC